MGNRANIIFQDQAEFSPAVYLHWNGGPESVMAFLFEMKRRGWMRMDYAAARFTEVVGEFFRGMGDDVTCTHNGFSLGVFNGPKDKSEFSKFCRGDNGLYVVTLAGKDSDDFEVAQHFENSKRKITFKNLKKILIKEGARYVDGAKDQPQRTYDGIKEFFLDHEKALKNFKKRGVK